MSEWERLVRPVVHSVPCWARPGPRPDAPLVILCHGMGFDPERNVKRWPRLTSLPVHILAPAGPYALEVRRGGSLRIGYAWYLYDGNEEPFRSTLLGSVDWLAETTAAWLEQHGFTPRERALVGYSQGAYFGSVAALRLGMQRLVSVAGRLREDFVAGALAGGRLPRTLVLHGEDDEAVSPEASRRTAALLRGAGAEVDLEITPGGHELHPGLDLRAATWLARGWGLPPPPSS